jgi:hypothetical protein
VAIMSALRISFARPKSAILISASSWGDEYNRFSGCSAVRGKRAPGAP